MRRTLVVALLLLFVAATLFVGGQDLIAKERYSKKARTGDGNLNVVDRPLWIPNRIADWISNNGQFVTHIPTGSAGLEWPAGSHNTTHFAGGIWLAGIKNSEIVTAAGEFVVEFVPGNILADGTASNSEDPAHRVYFIKPADVLDPLANVDYMNWPATAPRDDNGDPLIIGSSTAYAVFNDFNPATHNNLFSTKVMGVEVHMLAWAFDRPDAFGDMLFFKYTFINKSGEDVTDAYVGIWNDIDVGDAQDLVGSDTTLSLGFNYKTQADGNYGANPPAIGTDFFQGPIVPSPGDVANVSGVAVPDFRNLGMTSLAKYINGGPPNQSDPENGPEMYNFMRGLDGFGDPVIDPTTGQVTLFYHPGDPVAGTGWLDPTHNDKRYLMNSGPFTLAAGDQQEIVFGVIIAQGTDGVQSVDLLKRADAVAQLAYDINFALPPSPDNPEVTVSTQERSLFLTWDRSQLDYTAEDLVDLDANGDPTTYTLQGYNVWQAANAIGTGAKKIASFDIIDGVIEIKDMELVPAIGQVVELVVQDAKDTGLQHHHAITVDALSGNAPLIQNRNYYFAVTAYGYNAVGIPKTLESSARFMAVRPQALALGTDASGASPSGTAVPSSRVAGPSDGSISPVVVNPADLTDHEYRVVFRVDSTSGASVYDIVDVTAGNVVMAEGFTNQNDAEGPGNYPVVDGILVKVNGPPNDFKNFEVVANGAGPLDPPAGGALDFALFPVPERPGARQQVGDGQWAIHTADDGGTTGGGTRGGYAAFIDRATNGQTRWGAIIPFDYEWRFTAAGGYTFDAFVTGEIYTVPFELWSTGIGTPDDPSDDYRMVPNNLDADADGTFNLSSWGPGDGSAANGGGGPEHSASGGNDDPFTDWVYWYTPTDISPGSGGYDAWEADAIANIGCACPAGSGGFWATEAANDDNMRRTVLVNWNGGEAAPFTQDLPEEGTIFRITTTKPNTPADIFSYQATDVPTRDNQTLAKSQAAERVNVYPNPYGGFNIEETDPLNRFVTFTNLPDNAKLQIFNLAGELVRSIDHNGSAFCPWDLRNETGIPVASGMYIARIDMGNLGTKILRLAILAPQERLDVF